MSEPSLPYDYARCGHNGCQISHECLRFLAPGRPDGPQVYSEFPGGKTATVSFRWREKTMSEQKETELEPCPWCRKPALQWQPISTAPMDGEPDREGFARDMLDEWSVRDVEESELFDAALRRGLIREIPGGYDPENHIDAYCICPETGDPWYEYAFGPATPEADNDSD